MKEKKSQIGDLSPNISLENNNKFSTLPYRILISFGIFGLFIVIFIAILFTQVYSNTWQTESREFLDGRVLLKGNINGVQCENFVKSFKHQPNVFLTVGINKTKIKPSENVNTPQVVVVGKPELDSFCFRIIESQESFKYDDIVVYWFATASH